MEPTLFLTLSSDLKESRIVGKEASAGARPSADEQGQLQSASQLQQQRAVLTSLAVDPGNGCPDR